MDASHHVVRAQLLLYVLLFVALGISAIVGGGACPVMIGWFHGGWSEVATLPREWHVLLLLPPWLKRENPTIFVVVQIFEALLFLATLLVSIGMGLYLWRYLVVRKWKWVTDKEAKEVGQGDPGF